MRVLLLSRPGDLHEQTTLAKVGKRMVGALLRADPEMFVSWVLPKNPDETIEKYLEGLPRERIKALPVQRVLGERSQGYFVTVDLWEQLNQAKAQVPFDVVLNGQPALAMIYATVLRNRYQASRYHVDTPFVNVQQWTASKTQYEQNPETFAGWQDVVAEAMSAMFGLNVWESDSLWRDNMETVRPLVSPAVLLAMAKNGMVLHNGVPVERLVSTSSASGRPRLMWGGNLNAVKNAVQSLKVMARVQEVTGCDATVCTQSSDATQVPTGLPTWTIVPRCGQEEWYRQLVTGHVFVCNSKSEGYGSGWIEMMAAGLLGVFERKPWQKGLLPDWYPFIVTSEEEQVGLTVALVRQWPDGPLWKEWQDRVRQWVALEHDEDKQAVKWAALLREQKARVLERDREKMARSSLGTLMARAVAVHEEPVIGEDALYATMSEMASGSRQIGKRGDMISRMFLRRIAESLGLRDLCRTEVVEFVREG